MGLKIARARKILAVWVLNGQSQRGRDSAAAEESDLSNILARWETEIGRGGDGVSRFGFEISEWAECFCRGASAGGLRFAGKIFVFVWEEGKKHVAARWRIGANQWPMRAPDWGIGNRAGEVDWA